MTRDDQQGRLHPGCAIVLGAAAVLLALGWLRACSVVNMGNHGWAGPMFFPGFHAFLPLGIMGLIQFGLALWVGADARRRGLNGVLWGLLVFFTGIVGLLVYLLVAPAMQSGTGGTAGIVNGGMRPASAGATCPACSAAVQDDYKACPHCGRSLRCPHCDRGIQGGWKVCPYCTAPIEGAT